MKTLVIGPHPDDELLGCGGTLLRRSSEGHELGWVLTTTMTESAGWSSEQIGLRRREIADVRERLQIPDNRFYSLGFPAAHLEQIPPAPSSRK